MEHVRLVIAIVLSLALFLVWDLVFVDRQQSPPPPQQQQTTEEAGGESRQESGEKPAGTGDKDAERQMAREQGLQEDLATEDRAVPEKSVETISVETDLYNAVISEVGASITRFDLKEYRESPGPDAPRKALIPEDNRMGTAVVDLSGTDEPLYRAIFATDFTERELSVTDGPETISFFWQSDDGVVLEKRYTFYPDKYNIDMSVVVRNESDQILDRDLDISMTNPPPESSRRFTFAGPFIYMDQELNEINIDDIADQDTYTGKIQWAGVEGHYFMTALIPSTPTDTSVVLNLDQRANLLMATFQQPMDLITPGGAKKLDYLLFMGPKKLSLLRDFGHDLSEVVDFGIFSVIAKPALWLMNAIHNNIIANYGVAIILLTLLIKAVFWPLGNKSYKSMGEMRKIQPLMMEIRNKYKDDKKKMNEEVMNLYKTYKINPLSGCLPMVVQIPVFIAFYRMLYEAIELRHAPFMLWINDLSAPDRLFDFNISLPLMIEPVGIPVLTLIMGATMFLQQKLAPPPGDPMQARIMMMLPIVFTFIFVNFPAGLVLYWLVNNLVSIGQQYNVNRKISQS